MIAIKQQFTLKREEKLKIRKLIQQLFKEGKSFSYFPLRVIYYEHKKNNSTLQVAFSVSNKNFKRAVDRNRIKRLMREAYRLQKNLLQQKLQVTDKCFLIFIIYTDKTLPGFHLIFDRMNSVLAKLIKIISEE